MRSTHNRRLDRLKAVQNDHKLLKKHSAQLEEDLYGYVSKQCMLVRVHFELAVYVKHSSTLGQFG